MGRSIATPNDAEWSVYLEFDPDNPDFNDEWDWFVEGLTSELENMFPALNECNTWDGDECRGVLENTFGTFYISEYRGLVCLAFKLDDLSPRYFGDKNLYGLGSNWASGAYDKIVKIMGSRLYYCRGTASNGESFYGRMAA